jgi:hypothetical protein
MTKMMRTRLIALISTLLGSMALTQCGGSSTAATPVPSPAPVVVAVPPATVVAVTLSRISLSAATVVGGDSVTGTATLTAAAPTGGASVLLAAEKVSSVPATVLVPAGSTTASFTVFTRSVGGTEADTISGSYGGASASAVLSVTQPTVAVASFGVTGTTESDTCSLTNGGRTLECTFNGSTSSAPGTIVAWDWTFAGSATFTQTTTGAVLTRPATDCSLLPSPALPHDHDWFPLTVTLVVHDNLGNVSAVASNRNARVFPAGTCGF